MTKAWAIVENGVVVNTVLAEYQFAAEQGWVSLPDGVGIGFVWDGESFTAPPTPAGPVPAAVSSRQGQLALLDAGYLDEVEMMIASIPDESERRRAQIEFGATMWERSNPFLQQIWAGLGGDSDGLDDLFRAAIKL